MSQSCKTTSVRAEISILGCGYLVRFKDRRGRLIGSGHYVGKDRRCLTCNTSLCPSIAAVTRYLKAGGRRAPDPPPLPQAAALCPWALYLGRTGLSAKGPGAPPAAQDRGQTEEAPRRFWSMPKTCPYLLKK